MYYRAHKFQVDEESGESDFYIIGFDVNFNKKLELKVPSGYYIFPIISSRGFLLNSINKHDDELELLVYKCLK